MALVRNGILARCAENREGNQLMSDPQQRRAIRLGLTAVALWSTAATAFKLALGYLTPLQLVTLATLVSWCFLALRLLNAERWQGLQATSQRERLHCLLLGWLNPCLYYLVLFAAYERLPAQEAMAINYSWGLTLALMAAPLLGQKVSPRALLSAGISYVGILIIATRGAPASLDFAEPWGVGLALLSTVLWSLYWVMNTRTTVAPEAGLFLNFSGALPVLLLLCTLAGTPLPDGWEGWAGGVYVGLFEMGAAFILWLGAMKAARSTLTISSLIFLSPPLSLLFIWLIAGEPLEQHTLFGLGLILLGLWMQHRRSN